ncbi:MAG: hypothetical protein RR547_01150 [Raoultibacter sp.]
MNYLAKKSNQEVRNSQQARKIDLIGIRGGSSDHYMVFGEEQCLEKNSGAGCGEEKKNKQKNEFQRNDLNKVLKIITNSTPAHKVLVHMEVNTCPKLFSPYPANERLYNIVIKECDVRLIEALTSANIEMCIANNGVVITGCMSTHRSSSNSYSSEF